MNDGLPAHLAGLLQLRAYPHPVVEVRLLETHISWVLLTGEFAYKIKKPVCYPFVDFRSMQRREFFCREEVRLNRRFAPELYLDVCPIVAIKGESRIGGPGEVIEHAVKMQQFERGDELDKLIAVNRVEPSELMEFGHDLGSIHAGLPVALQTDPWGQPETIRAVILENFEQCSQASAVFGQAARVQALGRPLQRALDAAAPWISERLSKGRVRECHGDLHAANIVRRRRLVAFDCMEFEPAFRWIDVADEIAFLLADLDSQRQPLLAQAFLSGYLTQTGDYHACPLINMYKSHKALVRAKVRALKRAQGHIDDRQYAQYGTYLECAERVLAPKQPTLLLMCGLSGSGKTWLANHLAPPLNAVHLRSDIERKRLAGIDVRSHASAQVGQGLYSRDMSARVYEHLMLCAQYVLTGGFATIVDATFGRREHRARFRRLAARLGLTVCLVHCHASHAVLLKRIKERSSSGRDESDADISVLQWQEEGWQPIEADEGIAVLEADTTQTDPRELVQRITALSA